MSAPEDSRLAHDELTRSETAARWFWILGPLAAPWLQQQLSYVFVTWACVHRMPLALSLPALLALAITATAAIGSRREYQRHDRSIREEDASNFGSSRFFALTGLILSALAAALIIAMWLPTLFIDPCRR
jgi:hypothetical protein